MAFLAGETVLFVRGSGFPVRGSAAGDGKTE